MPFFARRLRGNRSVTVVAVSSLGIAIALNTVMFGVLDRITHPPRPFRDADRLYALSIKDAMRGDHFMSRGVADVLTRSGRAITSAATSERLLFPVLTSGARTRSISVTRVSPNYFDVIGVTPLVGRLIAADDVNRRVAVVSERYWRNELGKGVPSKMQLRINDTSFSVLGVLPGSAASALSGDVWIVDTDREPPNTYVSIAVRLRRDTDTLAAARELKFYLQRMHQERGGDLTQPPILRLALFGAGSTSLADYHLALSGAALCVLLIACANIATLLLARGMDRRHEFALRAALGASRSRLVWQLLSEYSVIALLGACLGMWLAVAGISVVTSAMPETMRVALVAPQLSWRVLAMGLAVCALTLFGFGLWPAIRASDVDEASPLKDGGATSTTRAGRSHMVLVAAEFALAIVLIVGSTLLGRTVYRLATFDFGYPMQGLVATQVLPTDMVARMERARQMHDSNAFAAGRRAAGLATREALAFITSSPGIRSAATFTNSATPDGVVTVADDGREMPLATYRHVSVSFFQVFRIPIVKGRAFQDDDLVGTPRVVVDEALAARLWPQMNPIGRSVKLGRQSSAAPWATVVGVSRPAHFVLPADVDGDALPLFAILSDSADRQPAAMIVARGSASAVFTATSLDRSLNSQLPGIMSASVDQWEAPFRAVLDRQSFLGWLFVGFGAIGLSMATIGLYGTMSYVVKQRDRELAIRSALGGSRRHLMELIFRAAAAMVLAGASLGALLAMWLSRFLDSVLYGVYQIDAPSLVAAELLLFGVAAAAAYLPAHRATGADPVDALRAH